jgi:hypothetical protein
MPDLPNLTVIIPVQSIGEKDALASTLASLHWTADILVADSVGLNLSTSKTVKHLPLIGLSEKLLHYRAALTTGRDWILFLNPGDIVTDTAHQRIETLLNKTESAKHAYSFPRKQIWHEVHWLDSSVFSKPDLILRSHYIEHTEACLSLTIDPLDTPLEYHVPSGGLIPLLQQQSQLLARLQLEDTGLPQIQGSLYKAWVKDVFQTGYREGFLKGSLFKSPIDRMRLLVSMMIIHFKWLALYTFTQTSSHTSNG